MGAYAAQLVFFAVTVPTTFIIRDDVISMFAVQLGFEAVGANALVTLLSILAGLDDPACD
jgi:uncharacterized membrane protein